MMKFIAYLGVVPALIMAILKAIEAFETPGFGAEKKQAVLNLIGETFDAFEQTVVNTPLSREEIVSLASRFIDVIVAFYNAIGKFKASGDVPINLQAPDTSAPAEQSQNP